MWINKNKFNYVKKNTRTIPNDNGLHIELTGSIKYVGFIIVEGETSDRWTGYLCLCTHEEWRAKLPHQLTEADLKYLLDGGEIGTKITV